MNANVIPAGQAADIEASGKSVAIGNSGETVEVWEYFALNIDDFATAKTIVDHFDANPRMLESQENDFHGLYVRAKLTLKRQAIAYAQAQAAMEKAREQSRSARSALKSAKAFIGAVYSTAKSEPTVLVAVAFGLLWYFR
jgi:hypothetical protein